MTRNDDVQAIREDVGHIARGCQSGRSHNPEVYQHSIDAALDRLAARLEAAETARDEIHTEVHGQSADDALAYVEMRQELLNYHDPLIVLADIVTNVRRLAAGRGEHG